MTLAVHKDFCILHIIAKSWHVLVTNSYQSDNPYQNETFCFKDKSNKRKRPGRRQKGEELAHLAVVKSTRQAVRKGRRERRAGAAATVTRQNLGNPTGVPEAFPWLDQSHLIISFTGTNEFE